MPAARGPEPDNAACQRVKKAYAFSMMAPAQAAFFM